MSTPLFSRNDLPLTVFVSFAELTSLAHSGLQKKHNSQNPNFLMLDTTSQLLQDSTYSSLRSSPDLLVSGDLEFFSESPTETEMFDDFDFDESTMLPPTTSTYNPQTKSIAPTLDPAVLREQLGAALAVTKGAWMQSPVISENRVKKDGEAGEAQPVELPPGFNELQGTELVELATSAIRAAKAYYYTTDSSLLLSTKDDKTLREKFLAILDVLKSMAQRKFEGGVKVVERDAVVRWICSVEESLAAEETAILEMRKKGREWLEGDWEGRDMGLSHPCLFWNNKAQILTCVDRSKPALFVLLRFLARPLASSDRNFRNRNSSYTFPLSSTVRPAINPNT